MNQSIELVSEYSTKSDDTVDRVLHVGEYGFKTWHPWIFRMYSRPELFDAFIKAYPDVKITPYIPWLRLSHWGFGGPNGNTSCPQHVEWRELCMKQVDEKWFSHTVSGARTPIPDGSAGEASYNFVMDMVGPYSDYLIELISPLIKRFGIKGVYLDEMFDKVPVWECRPDDRYRLEYWTLWLSNFMYNWAGRTIGLYLRQEFGKDFLIRTNGFHQNHVYSGLNIEGWNPDGQYGWNGKYGLQANYEGFSAIPPYNSQHLNWDKADATDDDIGKEVEVFKAYFWNNFARGSIFGHHICPRKAIGGNMTLWDLRKVVPEYFKKPLGEGISEPKVDDRFVQREFEDGAIVYDKVLSKAKILWRDGTLIQT